MKNVLFKCFLFLNIISIISLSQVANIFANEDKFTIYEHVKYKYEDKISETGIKTTLVYNENIDLKDKCKEIYISLPLKQRENILKEENELINGYVIDFKSDTEKGSIHYVKMEKENLLIVEYIETKYENNIDEVKKYLSDFGFNNTIFEYSKIFFENSTMDRIKDQIVQNIKEKQGKNINITSLNNGYSVTGFGGDANSIRVSGNQIDFNSSISKYNSKVEVIFATPVILKTY